MSSTHPNLVFVFGDQWRAQAFGYSGDPNAQTPNIDQFAAESFNFATAVANCPVCGPSRATLLTGQYPLTHGVFVNDVPLQRSGPTFGEALREQYDTAWIGKWHVDGHGRNSFIPEERRLGFDYWRGFECSHDYFDSGCYSADGVLQKWPGYDAESQTDDAVEYIRRHSGPRPYALFLSWGPPHNPYEAVPEKYKRQFPEQSLQLPDNIPASHRDRARANLAGYYAHGAALDEYFGRLLAAIENAGLAGDTIVVFMSDHGDTLGAHGSISPKQQPWDESIRVPLLVRVPAKYGGHTGKSANPIGIVDLMPTCLGLCAVPVPDCVQGADRSGEILNGSAANERGALIANYVPFHEASPERGGKEWRGLRTERYTYAKTLDGPWLLYDNEKDPRQLVNLIADAEHASLVADLDVKLNEILANQGDRFEPGENYLTRWNYVRDERNNQIPNHF